MLAFLLSWSFANLPMSLPRRLGRLRKKQKRPAACGQAGEGPGQKRGLHAKDPVPLIPLHACTWSNNLRGVLTRRGNCRNWESLQGNECMSPSCLPRLLRDDLLPSSALGKEGDCERGPSFRVHCIAPTGARKSTGLLTEHA